MYDLWMLLLKHVRNPEIAPNSLALKSFAQVQLFNTNPTGSFLKAERLRTLMEEGGISDCGNAQNCVKVCPKNIPLTDAIAAIGRDVSLQALKDIFGLPGRD